MPREATFDREASRQALRLALAMAISLTVAEARDQPFAFLTAMFAVQMLAKSPLPPTLGQGIGFAVIMALAGGVALTLCGLLLSRPIAYLLVLTLVFIGCFYLQARGKGGPVPQLLLVCNAMLPVLAIQSADLAVDFSNIMIDAALGAPLVVWLVHAILPSSPATSAVTSAPPPMSSVDALGHALLAAIVLMLPFAYFMFHAEEASIVILVTVIGIVGQAPVARGRVILGLLLGNLVGGIAASLAYGMVTLLPILAMLFLVTLLAGLVLAGRLFGPSPLAPVFGIALSTFLILFGLGLAPIGDGSGAAFISRIVDVALASLYAIGAVALFAVNHRSSGRRSSEIVPA